MGDADALVGKLLGFLLVQHAAVCKPHIVLVPAHVPAPLSNVQAQVCQLRDWGCWAATCTGPSHSQQHSSLLLATYHPLHQAASTNSRPQSWSPQKALGHTRCTCLDGICMFSSCSQCPPATQGCSTPGTV